MNHITHAASSGNAAKTPPVATAGMMHKQGRMWSHAA
jgi:hypothetical protein